MNRPQDFHRPEFIEAPDYTESLAQIEPDPKRRDVFTAEVQWALTRDLEGESKGHPEWETRVHVTKTLTAWPSLRVFFIVESDDLITLLDVEEA